MNISEFELIRRITKQIPARLREPAQLKDDAAVLSQGKRGDAHQLMTTDVIVENVDFILRQATPEHIGMKALGVNLSDIAAMGGIPENFTVALGIPDYISADWIRRFYNGLLVWARRFNVRCAGGDISKAPCFFSSITVLGSRRGKAVLRKNAQCGDWIGVTGHLGGSLSGHHLTFTPRLEEGAFLADNSVRAMIDISDGLIQDLNHVLEQSKMGCQLDVSSVPVSPAAKKISRRMEKDQALRSALTDGEDFELLFTANDRVRKKIDALWGRRFPHTKLSWIGQVIAVEHGWCWTQKGNQCEPIKITRKGYQHFK